MKRIIIAICAIATAFIISFVGYFSVNNACKKLENHLDSICKVAQNYDTNSAIKKSDDAIVLWEDIHGLVESFIRHEETDKLEEIIKSLPVYAQQSNMERLEQQANLAIDELHHLIRSEKPMISNIF